MPYVADSLSRSVRFMTFGSNKDVFPLAQKAYSVGCAASSLGVQYTVALMDRIA